MSHHSVSTSGDNASEIVMTAEEHQEFQNLPMLLTQWKRIQEEKQKLLEQKRVILEQISELDKRSSAMAGIMMGTMKKHSIAALDLKSSNARVVYKKSSRKAPLPKKEMTKLIAEHMKSETAAKELLAFLDAKKTTKVKEALVYEKNVDEK
ncbi:MAG: hypothetical protein EBU84_01255 [Actinobacteria bacterium]|jgi:hypothetical protein|nr:hypothetical protein [Actinomycetota bacterium]